MKNLKNFICVGVLATIGFTVSASTIFNNGALYNGNQFTVAGVLDPSFTLNSEVMRAATVSGDASAWPQMRRTRQPWVRRSRVVQRSRALLRVILCCQYSRFPWGMRQCQRQPCQKQPSTKMATRWHRKTKSGWPGSGWCLRQPLMRAARRMDTSLSSVSLLPREWIAAMTCERLRFEKTSPIFV